MMTAPVSAQTAPKPNAPAAAIDPAKLDVARTIVAVVLPPDQRDKMMTDAMNAMMKNIIAGIMQGMGMGEELHSNPKLRAVFERFIARQRDLALADLRVAMPELSDVYARAYARMFSLDDLHAIAAFVATAAGARFVQRSPALLSDPDVSEWQRRLAAKGAARQQAELAKFKAELLEVRDARPSGT
ncbi:MAG: DUF2059 domain-containing protein [Sphingomonas sp.]|nr:DUF2059 domain-containing protein [Sphingomonas sp.]